MMRSCFIVLLLCSQAIVSGQGYIVSRVGFSSRISNEFSPVYFRDGIVFCSNMRDNSPVGYTGEDGRLYRMFFAAGSDTTGWRNPVLFSKELTSGFNDGPATFMPDQNTIYFSRNNNTGSGLRNSIDMNNRLGIYIAKLNGKEWNDEIPFQYNDAGYFFSTPSLSPDGRRLYFSSDMPGGSGGMDLYYCESEAGGWSRPVNMGPVINTIWNESFPFADNHGTIWFASDGHKGFGRKDIFYTAEVNNEWIVPVNLDSAINSPEDDFGLVVDPSGNSGYFSSDRMGTDDIYHFRVAPPDFSTCDTVRENKYCFTFFDEQHHLIDTILADYFWDFGGGDIKQGTEVWHCFPGPGKYIVRLTITDQLTGDTISNRVNYDVDLKDIEQGYIKAPVIAERGEPIEFDGTRINLGGFSVTGYWWDFGNGFAPGGPVVKTTFGKNGEYYVKMGLVGKDIDGTPQKKCFMRKIRVN